MTEQVSQAVLTWMQHNAPKTELEPLAKKLAALRVSDIFLVIKQNAVSDSATEKLVMLMQHVVSLRQEALLYELLGNLYFKLSQAESAQQAYHKAVQLNSNLPGAYFGLAQLAQQFYHFEEAKQYLELALAKAPGVVVFLFQLASCELQLKNWLRAQELFEAIIAQVPDYAEAWANLGSCFAAQQDYAKAIYYFATTCRLDEENAYARSNLANCLLAQERYFEACDQYKLYLEKAPQDLEAWYQFGVAALALDDLAEAQRAFEKVVMAIPSHANALHNLAAIALKRHETSVAIGFYQRVLQASPQDEMAHYMIKALTQQGNMPEQAPPSYVKNLFDRYAKHFDSHLQQLRYQTPALLQKLWVDYQQQHQKKVYAAQVLDLGCGTGLMGEALTTYAGTITGVDLAAKMLDEARNKNCYHMLHEADLLDYLSGFRKASDFNYDLVVLADVLVYMGDLKKLFVELARLMKPHAQLLLSIESAPEADYQLTQHGRYQHHSDYLIRLMLQHGFKHQASQTAIIRYQEDKPVKGFLLLCERL